MICATVLFGELLYEAAKCTKHNKLDGSSSTQTSKLKDEITLLAKAWAK